MDDPGSSIWQRLKRLFRNSSEDYVEKAIRDASQDGALDKEEGSMLLSILELDDLQVQDIMTPRTDIICIEDSAPVTDVIDIIVSSGHSRIPVYKENRDNFIGIVHAKDIIRMLTEDENNKEKTASCFMRNIFLVPETKNALELLQEFRSRKQHLAVILDEYGGTAGLVSIEDVIEQIVGDIEDEHDAPRPEDIHSEPDGTFILSGRATLEDLAEQLSLNIVSEEVDTIGGYLCLISGRVPKVGDSFDINGAQFIVLNADAKQILKIRLTLPNSSPASQELVETA